MAAATVSIPVPGSSQRINNPLLTPAFIPVQIVGSATVYATATGGFPADFYQVLLDASNPAYPISYKDILGFIGISTLGYTVGQFAIGTPTASTLPVTFRLWNGATESADAANSQTVNGFLIVARNGAN